MAEELAEINGRLAAMQEADIAILRLLPLVLKAQDATHRNQEKIMQTLSDLDAVQTQQATELQLLMTSIGSLSTAVSRLLDAAKAPAAADVTAEVDQANTLLTGLQAANKTVTDALASMPPAPAPPVETPAPPAPKEDAPPVGVTPKTPAEQGLMAPGGTPDITQAVPQPHELFLNTGS